MRKNVTKIYLPDNMELLSGEYNKQFEGINSEIKLIAYYDSAHCSNCAIKNSYIWSDLVDLFLLLVSQK